MTPEKEPMTAKEERVLRILLPGQADFVIEQLADPMPGGQTATPEIVDSYRGRVSDFIVQLWEQFGFASFHNGLLKLTNPTDYTDYLSWWLSTSPLPEHDNYHVVARGPFGTLCVWAERTSRWFTVDVSHGLVAVATVDVKEGPANEFQELQRFRSFLKRTAPPHPDYPNQISRLDVANGQGHSFYNDCVAEYGPLTDPTQVFGFAPYLFLDDGGVDVKNVERVDEFVQMDLIRDFMGEPKFVDISTYPG